MATPDATMKELLGPERPDAAKVREFLDRLDHTGRMTAVTSLQGTSLQAKLYDMAKSAPPVTLAELVPADLPALREVIWHGKNSLPMFTLFQKRFCRPRGAQGEQELWGYNHQAMGWVTGPGYFVCHQDGPVPAAIDYRVVPPEAPPGWPEVKRNDQGLSRFVYANMVDYLRRVSAHVLIGRAHRGGKELPNYFLLCREPGSAAA
jgi:hypothetical protein